MDNINTCVLVWELWFWLILQSFCFHLFVGKKLSGGKGLGGTGRLTHNRMDTIQNFYGRAIRDNKGNAKEMAKATHAILKHYSSTLEEPKHNDCPSGPTSWCSFQRDRANGTNCHKPIKNPLPDAMVEVLQPLFNRLGDETFLVGCENSYTQNRNECLHHVIWGMAAKEMFSSPWEISLAISTRASVPPTQISSLLLAFRYNQKCLTLGKILI